MPWLLKIGSEAVELPLDGSYISAAIRYFRSASQGAVALTEFRRDRVCDVP